MQKPEYDILPDQCAAEVLGRRGEIIAEYEAALEGKRSPDYDHGIACDCYAAVQHGEFLRHWIAALASGVMPDETTIAQMLDSATQFWARSLHNLDQVGDGPWVE